MTANDRRREDRPTRSRWNRRGLQVRVLLLVGLGLLASMAIMGGATWLYLGALGRQLLAERGMQARSVASHVEYVVQSDLETLQGISSAPSVNLEDAELEPERIALGEATLRSRLFDRVLLIDTSGHWLSEHRPAVGAGDQDLKQLIESAQASGRPSVSRLIGPHAVRRAYALVPLRNWQGQVVAIAVGEIDPASPRFAQLLPAVRIAGGSVDLLDDAGFVLTSTDSSRVGFSTGQAAVVRDALGRREPLVKTCEDCRQPDQGAHAISEVVAVSPVDSARWAVDIRQPEQETFGSVFALDRNVAIMGFVLLVLALLFAWGVARSVRNPLALLTGSAERIAGGDLAQPIPALPDDEVGRLGRSLEHMRVALKSSIEDVERANVDLENRVRERTRELEGLYRQLREREEWRSQLLAKVIGAQEDERKRLARELHDETSQTLNALVMRLETAVAGFPTDASRQRLLEAKDLTVRTLDELHRLIYDLRPSVLDDLGLLSAIRWYAERTLEPLGVAVRWEFSGQERRLKPEIETALFRVAQEAITNIGKYAHAESVLIQCVLKDDAITIEIEDDGDGFDPATLPSAGDSRRGLGLMGMRERVELLRGTIDIDAAPGQGVRIAVTVPLREWALTPADNVPGSLSLVPGAHQGPRTKD